MEYLPSRSPSILPYLPNLCKEDLPPFSQQLSDLTKQEHIQLKCDIAFWKSQHTRSVNREQLLKKELKQARREIHTQAKVHTDNLEQVRHEVSDREKALQKELDKAQGEILDLRQRLYGRKSEQRTSRNDQQFVNPASPRNRGQQENSKGHGNTQRPDLPVDDVELDFPEGDACCSTCNKPFIPIAKMEDSDFIEVEVCAHIRRIKRKCYLPGCQCENLPGIITAPLPPRLLPRNILGVSIWADVLLDKYLYARPTHSLLQYYKTLALPISQGTITDGLKRLAPMFEPLVEAMHSKQMTESLFRGDETRWMVYKKLEGKTGYRWYLWIMISESVMYYLVAPGRGANVPKDHFDSLDKTIQTATLVCDRYSSYKKLAKDMPVFELAFCWAHVRRDFIDAARRFPEYKEWMFDWVEKIKEIYHINKQRLRVFDKEQSLKQQSQDFHEHHKNLENALFNIEQQRDEHLCDENLSDPQKAVLTSLRNHWAGLTIFVVCPQVPMDNNESERGIRKAVNGRKNYYGSGSQWSADLMASMLTLLQTILRWGINPRHWMTAFLSACAENGSQPPSDLSPFLPWKMDEDRKQFLSQPISDKLSIRDQPNPKNVKPPDTS